MFNKLVLLIVFGMSGFFYGGAFAAGKVSYSPHYVDADEVVDKATLKSFVQRAKRHLLHRYDKTIVLFRNDPKWKSGSTYLYILDMEGNSIFHATMPDLEGSNLRHIRDANGTPIVDNLIAAAKAGGKEGGYTEYLWDNPADDSDDETGTPKIAYVVSFGISGKEYLLGSGIYPSSGFVAESPERRKKLDKFFD